ncbi:MAG: TerB family tellurite resistance protein, partial [Bdellovibrionales bacterium]|nr:TerB family tellurite resistance protein [Bdellovibrionales bacterium]
MTTSREKDPFGPSPEQQRQRQIFVTTFSMLAKLMYIDGKTSREEARILDTIMDHELELTAERKRFAIEVIRLARDDGQTFED